MSLRPLDAQQMHDLENEPKDFSGLEPGSRARLEKLLRKKAKKPEPPPDTAFDPIESAMSRHPGLSRETAEEMARDLGF